ncbi:tetratricopeptide repeat protein 28-like [Stylophora pistillata]|uniref:tetratricopeptide repeat protein 28-like n=1 Tax=Stylophora pistillata TaxID=50429 RepID=UPI000C055148|nr:tetratricopeptide repeat protein 28-like [Stylophora pistillata]
MVEDMVTSVDIVFLVAVFLLNSDRVQKAIDMCSECLILLNNTNQHIKDQFLSLRYGAIYDVLFRAYRRISDYMNAERYGRRLLVLYESGDLVQEGYLSVALAEIVESQNRFTEAKKLYKKGFNIMRQTGEKIGEANACIGLGNIFHKLGENLKAKKYFERALVIKTEIGDRNGEASCYGKLGTVCQWLGQYNRAKEAKEYLEKALVTKTEIGERIAEASCYGILGAVCRSLGEYDRAKEYLEKALVIITEIGERNGEASCYGILGAVHESLGEYDRAKDYLEKAAKEYLEKALVTKTEIGDRTGEASCYETLGAVCHSRGQYNRAKEYLEKALVIRTNIGDRNGEATCYGSLGTVCHSRGQYNRAKEYLEKALVTKTEIGDRNGEATCYVNLGSVFQSLGQYDRAKEAKEYLEKALVIRTENGNREGEASCHGNLGVVFWSLGQYDKAKEYHEKALVIRTEIGDRNGEANCYANLGSVCHSLGQYERAKEYLEKALVITTEVGDRKGEASCYGNLGGVCRSLRQYGRAKEYHEKALVIRTKIGDRRGEATDLADLGTISRILGDYEASELYLERALIISRDIGGTRIEFEILETFAILYFFQIKMKDSLSCLHQCIVKYEELRDFLGLNDQFKTSFLEQSGVFPYKLLGSLLCRTGNTCDALYVEELSRARGLSDLMAKKYSVETYISANPQSWFGIENVLRKENNCTCLYISCVQNDVYLWILKTSGAIHFKRISQEENLAQAGLPKDLPLSTFLADNFRSLGILPSEDCEDRSLNMVEPQPLTPQQKSSARVRLLEEDEKVISSLSLCYKIFIAPVYDLLEEPELIIVPHSTLYKVPFAALGEKEGAEYLSETRRIRVIPSLTTLKIIQDSPEDYHSNTGALIIGNPKVDWLLPLPGAGKEAAMVGRLVGVPPLVEDQATKQAVLERISSVSLIHFAAHGNAERGEIALSPNPTLNSQNTIPSQEAYMLTMADVSRVKVRAKLVVLSCCHSGSGQIRAEGVIGIARAFLGSGARSVLAALWAIPDSATEQLMSRFYEHLVGGKSASESLHHAMKWMRINGFTKVSEWASFTLIGDDVRLEFGT